MPIRKIPRANLFRVFRYSQAMSAVRRRTVRRKLLVRGRTPAAGSELRDAP